jgi:hypothetical protein
MQFQRDWDFLKFHILRSRRSTHPYPALPKKTISLFERLKAPAGKGFSFQPHEGFFCFRQRRLAFSIQAKGLFAMAVFSRPAAFCCFFWKMRIGASFPENKSSVNPYLPRRQVFCSSHWICGPHPTPKYCPECPL